jgi:hypothetical protein
MRLPSAAALQRTAVAGIAGAGIALVGLSVSGFAGLDSNLRAATEQQYPAVHQVRSVGFAGQQVRDCHRPDSAGHPGDDAPSTGPHQPT